MRTTTAVLSALALGLLAVTATSAVALPRSTPNVTFFQGGAGTAQWVGGESSDTADDQAIALGVPAAGDYAGAVLNRTDGTAPDVSTPPSFMFKSSVANASSGGSPRLVILWSDGGKSELRPLSWPTDWTLVDGAGPNWDNNGGTCGFQYATTYDATVDCHTGATVVSVFLVSDSGWLASPYTHYIDEVSYDGMTFSSASDNRRVPQGS